ncbi:zinc ribbon domain-containing protein [Chromobacterium vaccinii]|nr:zinc ribbon domain-containing protein [Chromobacterium vaccinii]
MAKRDLSKQLESLTFRCPACGNTFDAAPGRVEDAPEFEHHPFAYFAECTRCGEEAAQAPFHKSLVKAWANSTGPKTPAGKAASARNLEGHPTAEEALRTRFNALKHGMTAETAQYFPARPGKYPACSSCDVDPGYCAKQPACIKQTQLFMVHHAAFEQRNPKHLTPIYSSIQASITAIIQQILQTIIADGVKLEHPAWAVTREGDIVIGEYNDFDTGEKRIIMETKAHPLLKPLQEFLSRNNLALSDMGMTPKAIEQEEQGMGRLAPAGDGQKTLSLEDYAAKQAESMAALRALADRANARKQRDPVLIEYQQQNGGEQ